MCAYCGYRVATDREHVFPKSLYPESKASSRVQRLTIPSCNECNNGWSDDEAHFRNVLALAGEPNDSRRELWETKIGINLGNLGEIWGKSGDTLPIWGKSEIWGHLTYF
jgi:hypothetical protein